MSDLHWSDRQVRRAVSARRPRSTGVHAPGGGVTYPRKCAFIFTTLESRSRTDPFDVSASILQSAESPGTGPNFDEPNPRVAAGRSARRSRADRAETSGNETTGATLKFSCCAETLTASVSPSRAARPFPLPSFKIRRVEPRTGSGSTEDGAGAFILKAQVCAAHLAA